MELFILGFKTRLLGLSINEKMSPNSTDDDADKGQ